MKTCIAAVSALIVFAGAAGAETLNKAAITSVIVGKTVCIPGKDEPICVLHKPDGTSQVVSGLPAQKGRWRFSGDQMCITWEKVRNGKEGCLTFSKDGNAYTAVGQGKITFR